jgi:hypothetical protein
MRDAATDRDGSGPSTDWPDSGIFPPADGSVPVDVGSLGGAACGGIEYPVEGFGGPNILVPSFEQAKPPGEPYVIAAKLAPSASLVIAFLLVTPLTEGTYGVEGGGDFRAKGIGPTSVLFEAKLPGQNERGMAFRGDGRAVIEYFECGATTPTGTKMLYWAGLPGP